MMDINTLFDNSIMYYWLSTACSHVELMRALIGAMMAGLVVKPGVTKSTVWALFGFEGNESGEPIDESWPVCKECCRTVATKGGTTSNLLLHL